MRCPDVQMALEAYVDGELSAEQAASLKQHLAGCRECRIELARLQAVMAALETWPPVAEPVQLTDQIMRQVRSRPTPPAFRLRWSDLAISTAGAGFVFAAMLCWRDLTATDWSQLYRTQMSLHLEMLRLEALLQARRLLATIAITPAGELVAAVGVVLIVALILLAWGLTGWNQRTITIP
jgi:anti-sigma factor RsiW